MKIAVDARALCVPIFGIGRYTREILDRLIGQPDTEWFLYADRPLPVAYPDHENVTTSSFGSANRLLSLGRTQLAFARWAIRDRVDLFWSPRHHLPLLLDSRIRTVVTVHDLVWKVCPETMLRANRWVEGLLMPASVKKADAIICVSESTQQDLRAHFPRVAGKSVTILEAAGGQIEAAPNTSSRYFLFVGTLEPRKNLGRLIEAFALARSRGMDDCRLIIAGAAGWNTAIDQAIRSAGVDAHVDVLGHVDDNVLHGYLAGAIALCLPSLYEGFGLPALEAMQYGTPVIGPDRSSIPEIVGEAGLLVDPLSIEDIASAMVRLATDDELRGRLSRSARSRAGQFSWDTAAVETFGLFEQLVAR